MYLIGTDIGTQGTKTVMVDETGKLISQSFREYGVITPRPSWAEQWPDVWLNAVIETLKECVERAGVNDGEIAGLAVSGLYGGSGIPVDKNMVQLRPALIWMDRRAREQTQWVKDNISREKIFDITGNYVDSYYGFTKIMWIRDNEPEIWKQIYQLVTPKDYVIYHLTGELATDYSSAGNIGGLLDIRKKVWSKEMAAILGIPIELLPERLTKSSDVIGTLGIEAARMTGLHQGLPVIAGGIDAPVAQLSAGVTSEGEHVAMIGTSMCWGTVNDGNNLAPGLISFPYVVDDLDKIYTFGGSATSGALPRWFRDEFGVCERELEKSIGVSAYTLFEKETAGIGPGSDGVMVLPYFMGERSPIWDPDARGTIIGLSLYHRKAHIYRAILEAVAYTLRDNMEEGLRAGLKLDSDCWLVGGVARSDFWVQILADVTGFSMKRLDKDVEAPLGDAFLAGLGTGIFSSSEEIKKWINFKPTTYVDPQTHKIYGKYFEIFRELYADTKKVTTKLVNIN